MYEYIRRKQIIFTINQIMRIYHHVHSADLQSVPTTVRHNTKYFKQKINLCGHGLQIRAIGLYWKFWEYQFDLFIQNLVNLISNHDSQHKLSKVIPYN